MRRDLVGSAAHWCWSRLLAWISGCGAELPPPGPDHDDLAPASTPAGSVSIPADGATLRSFGYTFGPVEQLSLPRSAVISATVDQANNVTAVLSAPRAGEVAAYLRQALPAAGFSITDDDPVALTLTFTGHGWRGSFTGNEAASALCCVRCDQVKELLISCYFVCCS